MPVGVARGVAARLLLHDEAVLRRDALARGAVRRLHVAQRQVARTLCCGRQLQRAHLCGLLCLRARLLGGLLDNRPGRDQQRASPTSERSLDIVHNSPLQFDDHVLLAVDGD